MSLETEKKTIAAMIRIYCKDLHNTQQGLCDACMDLQQYAFKRIEHCPLKYDKPACNGCTVHCYTQVRRDKVRLVMIYSGRRMLFRHPYLTLIHYIKRKKIRKRSYSHRRNFKFRTLHWRSGS